MENKQSDHLVSHSETDVAGFISKTYEILNNQQYTKIIHWGQSGKEFIIKDVNKFQQIVLPQYFRHKKINSFVRQLNMYGFHKSRKDNSKCIFSHPNFIKDREDLLSCLKRKIKNIQSHIKTPIKEQKLEGGSKGLDETCAKQITQQDKKVNEEQLVILPGLLESQNCLNSLINLNTSLKKISINNFDDFIPQEVDQQLSIAENIIEQEKQPKQKAQILNPSFFFTSFNECN